MARAISKAIADSASIYRADLTTKSDLAEVKAEMKSDLAEVRAELKSDLVEVRADLLKLDAKLDTRIAEVKEIIASTQNRTIVWMFGMLVTFAGAIIAAIKLV